LEGCSHIWLIFVFHDNANKSVKSKVYPPRLDGASKVGVLTTRSPHHPNPVGLSLAKVERIVGATLHLSGIDLIDGTPVLDIKPYIPDYDSVTDAKVPSWMTGVRPSIPSVTFTEEAEKQLKDMLQHCKFYESYEEIKGTIVDILKNDPRSTYRKKKCHDEIYAFKVDGVNVRCLFDKDDNVTVYEINDWTKGMPIHTNIPKGDNNTTE